MEFAFGVSLVINYVLIGIMLHLAYAVRTGFKRTLNMEQDFNPEELMLNTLLYPLYLQKHMAVFFQSLKVNSRAGLNSSQFMAPGVQHYKVDFTTTVGESVKERAKNNDLGNIFDVGKRGLKRNISVVKNTVSVTPKKEDNRRIKAGEILSIKHVTTRSNTYNPEKMRLKHKHAA